MFSLAKFSAVIGEFKKLYNDAVDDFVDRLSCAVSVTILTAFFVMTSGKLSFGNPISCLFYAEQSHLGESWLSYYVDRCFINGILRFDYGNSTHSHHARPEIDKEFGRMTYYMWSPYLLLAFAFAFLIPKFFLNLCLECHPVDYRSLLKDAKNLGNLYGVEYQEKLKESAMWIKLMCEASPGTRSCGVLGAVGYVLTKWLYVANLAVQFFVLKNMVGGGQLSWGWDVLVNNIIARRQSTLFPFTGVCPNDMSAFHNPQHHSFQCVLPINMLNEKIFVFLWFWLIFVLAFATCSALYTTMIFLMPSVRRNYVVRLMQISEDETEFDHRSLKHFVHRILLADGLLIFVLIKEDSGSIIASNMCRELFLLSCENLENEMYRSSEASVGMNSSDVFTPKLCDGDGDRWKWKNGTDLYEKVLVSNRSAMDPTLTNQPYYHDLLPREDIKQMLRVNGDFLVRSTEPRCGEPRQYVLSVMYQQEREENGLKHFVVQRASNGKFHIEKYAFDSISAMVEYHLQQK